MSVEVVVRSAAGGIDWALAAAVVGGLGSASSALFTFLLWRTAKGELAQLLLAASQADRGRLDQLRAADAARMDALRPVVTVERGGVRTSGWVSIAEVDLRNIGVGPAVGATVLVWFKEGQPAGTSIDTEPTWRAEFGPIEAGKVMAHGGARWTSGVQVDRMWEPGWLVCKVEYRDVFSRTLEDWWSAWVDFQQTPSWRHGWAD